MAREGRRDLMAIEVFTLAPGALARTIASWVCTSAISDTVSLPRAIRQGKVEAGSDTLFSGER